MVYYNNNNNNINNRKILENIKEAGQSQPYIVFGLIFICIIIIVYVIYKYAVTNDPLTGYTYYSNDLLKLNPLFTEQITNINECITLCEKQGNCDGITYDANSNICIGQKDGRLRTDEDHLSAWVKKKTNKQLNITGIINDVSNIAPLISNIKSNNRAIIESKEIPNPPFPNNFTYSFVIKIKDLYENFSYWRHILHKGTPIDKSTNTQLKTFQYQNWEKIRADLPEQTLGFWLSPFQNNLRVAISTISKSPLPRTYDQANVEKCRCDNTSSKSIEKLLELNKNNSNDKINCSNCWITDQENDVEHTEDANLDTKDMRTMDYIDIQDIQTNVPTHIVVSVKGLIVEVYVDGVFRTSKVLNGNSFWNNGSLYIHNPKTYNGEISDLRIIPGALNGDQVRFFEKSVSKTLF